MSLRVVILSQLLAVCLLTFLLLLQLLRLHAFPWWRRRATLFRIILFDRRQIDSASDFELIDEVFRSGVFDQQSRVFGLKRFDESFFLLVFARLFGAWNEWMMGLH